MTAHPEPNLVTPDARGRDPVDRVHLARYTLGDANLEREVLDLFLGQMPTLLAALRCAATEREWFEVTHTIKGAGAAVGAWHVAALAAKAQGLSLSEASERRGRVVEGIAAAIEDVARYVAAAFPPAEAGRSTG